MAEHFEPTAYQVIEAVFTRPAARTPTARIIHRMGGASAVRAMVTIALTAIVTAMLYAWAWYHPTPPGTIPTHQPIVNRAR